MNETYLQKKAETPEHCFITEADGKKFDSETFEKCAAFLKLPKEIFTSTAGFRFISRAIDLETFPQEVQNNGPLFKSRPLRSEQRQNIDKFGKIKSVIINEMFLQNPEMAREFCGLYLADLAERRRWQWIKKGWWIYDMDKSEAARYEEETLYQKHTQENFFEENSFSTRKKVAKNVSDELAKIEEDSQDTEYFDELAEFEDTNKLYDDYLATDEMNTLRNGPDTLNERLLEIYGRVTKTILDNFGKYGKSEDIEKIVAYLFEDDYSKFHMDELTMILQCVDQNKSMQTILDKFETQDLRYIKLSRIILLLTDIANAEEVRIELGKKIEQKTKRGTSSIDTLERAYSLITPCSDKTAITNLQKFYQENIKFEEYAVNKKMNEKEVSLLKSLMRKNEKILEMGCGTGRLISEMHKAGYDISGFDFTERHVDIVKKENPDLEVFQADWHDTKLPDQSQDVIYSLGRNTSHDYSFIDQVATFREANRLLKPGGKFIFDIANREKGGYKTMIDGYAEEMKKRGIKNFRYGSIYDSPDNEHFATRYAYSHEDIVMLAQLTGFEIKLTKSEPLETGNGDENLYYVLEKK